MSELTDLTDTTAKVKGVGWVEWPIGDVFGQVAVMRTQAYYVPEATIRSNSPQSYFDKHKAGKCTFDHFQLVLTTAMGTEPHITPSPTCS